MIISSRVSTKCINIKPDWWVRFHTICQEQGLIMANVTFVFPFSAKVWNSIDDSLKSKSCVCFKNVLKELIISNYWLVHWWTSVFHSWFLFIISFFILCVCVCVCVCVWMEIVSRFLDSVTLLHHFFPLGLATKLG